MVLLNGEKSKQFCVCGSTMSYLGGISYIYPGYYAMLHLVHTISTARIGSLGA